MAKKTTQVTITRKIELRVNTDNVDEKNKYYDTIKKWRDVATKGANMAISEMYTNLKGEEYSFLEMKINATKNRVHDFDDLDGKEKSKINKEENQAIYKEINEEKKEFFGGSDSTYYYGLLSKYYGNTIPSVILGCISRQVASDFTTDKKAYLTHLQSLRTYKNKMPIPFTSQSVRNVRRNVYDNKEQKDFAFQLFGIPFRTRFGKDRSNNYHLMNQCFQVWFMPDIITDNQGKMAELIMKSREDNSHKNINVHNLGNGLTISINYKSRINNPENDEEADKEHVFEVHANYEEKAYDFLMIPCEIKKQSTYKIQSKYKFCDSKIQIMKEAYVKPNGVKSERTKIFLLASISFEKEAWTLDPEKTAYCELDPDVPLKVTISNRTTEIGTEAGFKYRRMGIQGCVRGLQRALTETKGGRGRRKKLKALEAYSGYEQRVVKLKVHEYSKQLIDLCLENNCKYIYLRKPKVPDTVQTDEQKLLIRNWSYGLFDTSILYKAEAKRIEVIYEEKETA